MSDLAIGVSLLLRFVKLGRIRFIGHLDVARVWERALRRVGVPMAYTEGFTPRPRVSFGLALPTCHQSLGEYLEVRIRPDAVLDAAAGGALEGTGPAADSRLDVAALPALLSEALPPGLDCVAATLRPANEMSLQEAVTSCAWRFEIRDLDADQATDAVAALLAAPHVVVERQRKGTTVLDDIRPAVQHLEVLGPGSGGVELAAVLAAKPRVVRPSELCGVLAPGHDEGLVTRTHQWIERDGEREEPLPHHGAPRAEVHV